MSSWAFRQLGPVQNLRASFFYWPMAQAAKATIFWFETTAGRAGLKLGHRTRPAAECFDPCPTSAQQSCGPNGFQVPPATSGGRLMGCPGHKRDSLPPACIGRGHFRPGSAPPLPGTVVVRARRPWHSSPCGRDFLRASLRACIHPSIITTNP